jgi:hypothetical protein
VFRIGSLIKVVDDPYSFAVKEKYVGSIGIIIEYENSIYTVLLSGNKNITIKLLDFMMEKIQNEEGN